jgi:hypothetical protein
MQTTAASMAANELSNVYALRREFQLLKIPADCAIV